MLTRWNDMDRTFAALDEFRRRMDRLFHEFDGELDGRPRALRAGAGSGAWPRAALFDAGKNLVLKAEVPGLSEKDINISLNQEVMTVSGERKSDAPEGYAVHRRERGAARFARSFQFPCRIDPENVTATTKNGILTVVLPKAAESQPRTITVRAQS